ncbi:uncharacterized protein BDR25DRAFT_313372 [Lindgomyces ingoldianus]|uniref:Uncharacterized protein n=1 Tax=Lindgomyces ingoldianus TaxID=673940 RepID=A0ACB6R183_9PLEO|nr:uncharacterized protein BDR25DRAFT_313372 [Lindgomyces ingoldianus]KAF2472206.1 hypothetical protein BDR25DRAFT_313372 [Lindgomyces ingoldianus]
MRVAANLVVIVAIILVTLCSNGVVAKSAGSAKENSPNRLDALSLAIENEINLKNATFQVDHPHVQFGPAQLPIPEDQSPNYLIPRELTKLFKRTCYFPTGGGHCGDGQICCTDQGDSSSNWCCKDDTQCVPRPKQNPNGWQCSWSKTWVVIWYTSTVYTTKSSTDIRNVAETTKWSTISSTSTVVVTRSDVDTSTEVKVVTVTARVNNRRRLGQTKVAPLTSALPAKPTKSLPIALVAQAKPQGPIAPLITSGAQLRPRGWFKRTLTTETATTSSTTTNVQTRVIYVTSVSYYTETSTTTSTSTSTSTYVANAKKTVTSTSTTTLTLTPGQSAPTPASTKSAGGGQDLQENPPTPGGGGGNGGTSLSKGAQAGIATGTASGSLIICIILAFCIRRRRKKRKEEVAELINAAVAAANNAQSSVPPPEKPPHVGVYAPAAPVPSPPFHTSSYSPNGAPYGRLSDLVPVYSPSDSTARNTPASGLGSPTGLEMSSTPIAAPISMQYQYPRPMSPEGSYEMYHPPPEMPSNYQYPMQRNQPEWRP